MKYAYLLAIVILGLMFLSSFADPMILFRMVGVWLMADLILRGLESERKWHE